MIGGQEWWGGYLGSKCLAFATLTSSACEMTPADGCRTESVIDIWREQTAVFEK